MPFNLKLKYQDHLLWLMTSDIEQQHHHHLFNILYLFMISKFFPPFFRNISIHPEFPWLPACHAAAVPLRLPWPSTKPRPSVVPWTCRQGCSVGAARRGQANACKPKGAGNGWDGIFEGELPNSYVGWMKASKIEVEEMDWKKFEDVFFLWKIWEMNVETKNGTCLVKDVFFLERRGIKMDLSLSKQMISCLKMETEIKLWRGSDALSCFNLGQSNHHWGPFECIPSRNLT